VIIWNSERTGLFPNMLNSPEVVCKSLYLVESKLTYGITLALLFLTCKNALVNFMLWQVIRYAIMRDALLEIPATQCTSTLVFWIFWLMNWLLLSKNYAIWKRSWSSAGRYKYLGNADSEWSSLWPRATVTTAYIWCSNLQKKYFEE
jgi:hypothetical protein